MEEGGEKLACVLSSKMDYYCPVRTGILYLIDCMIKKGKKKQVKSNMVSMLALSWDVMYFEQKNPKIIVTFLK